MRRTLAPVLAAIAILAVSAGTVAAAVTWKAGPTVTFNGTTSVTATGEASGLGNVPAEATLTVHGTVTYTCVNKGGNESPVRTPSMPPAPPPRTSATPITTAAVT